jgi:ribosomal protein S18 acetylase RimI-like enzyme
MPGPAIAIRPLQKEDLPVALAIQGQAYPPFLVEDADAFASRMDVAASFCLAAVLDDVVVGYLLAHGWPRQQPPSLGAVLGRDAPSEVLFIHDLAIAPAGRGLELGRLLVGRAFELASATGLRRAELIAVEGAARYWRSLGFTEIPLPSGLAAKVALYGDEARWMTRDIKAARELRDGFLRPL